MPEAIQHYKKLHEISRNTRILEGIDALLHWDQETYMPEGAAAIRAEQQKIMAGLIHKGKIAKPFVNTLSRLIDIKSGKILAKGLGKAKNAALKVWRKEYLKEVALPTRFVEDFAKLTSQSLLVWRSARQENSFRRFAPYLEKIIQMNRQKADLLGFQAHPYDALLDSYEPGMTTERLTPTFSDLKQFLVGLIKKIQKKPPIDDRFLFGKFAKSKQIAFSQLVLKGMHYDMHCGRLDFSIHPFSSASHPTDSRITTRIHPTSLLSNLRSVMHEAGHGLYERGLPMNEYGSPLGQPASLGIHESQSRWWETRIGQSLPFWKYYFPLLQKEFKGFQKITLEEFYKASNKVQASFIRVEADEVTYNLHVILRFEIEKALIEGSLPIKEIPEAWNEKLKQFLGLIPSTDSEGCLQDIHWSLGCFGYFPTYSLGNLYAAQLFSAFEKESPDWENKVAKGEMKFIKEWLAKSIFQFGQQYSSVELVEKISGSSFSSKPFCNYLESKYKAIYAL
ncbi:carboxypeptidase M32 [Parachlamydia sp. AcF125]|uniref:carboxypeptidase M32 n=1 Tax=Parachlamydia sp. AcF125 TaxID=2795736 RepID=UPI001BC9C2BD|nr:carboxypeptidase M32 [Parachlamydia sp. AcF125]MBS4169111.1 Thermostable carboxypeptidase 1 [Parachlamydia sp. AcF125]